MTALRTFDDLLQEGGALNGKRVLVRVDFNVPMQHGKVTDATRIERTLPTIQALVEKGAKVILLSHFGAPQGTFDTSLTLGPITDVLGEAMGGVAIRFGVDCVGSAAVNAVSAMEAGDVLLLENLRFHLEEKANDAEFAKALASLGDVYVNEAFSCSHRSHASIVGIPKHLPAYCGAAMQKEIAHLQAVLEHPKRPVTAIIGGSKISTKIRLLGQLVPRMDHILVGGGLANTFLAAAGHDMQLSLVEKDMLTTAKDILKEAETSDCTIHLPVDAVTALALAMNQETQVAPVGEIPQNSMMLDIGPCTVAEWSNVISTSHTLVWNGPLGAFEVPPFDVGTIQMARVVAYFSQQGTLKSIAGGGDVLAALARAGLRASFSYVSTAGGAFLDWLEGEELPGIQALKHVA